MREGVLIFVAGLTPQVVTETLYYLTQVSVPPRAIDEIYLLTTSMGKKKALADLLDATKGRFYAFCKEYDMDYSAVRFDPDHIIAIQDKNGVPLTDIRTSEDNAALADFIMSFVREKTSDPDCVFHCSVAGGRKTMSLFLGLELQFFGRAQDRLSHVLIWPPELEGNPDFFYFPKSPRPYRVGKREVNSRDIWVHLAEIPLLLLKEKIPILKEKNRLSYSELVQRVQKDFELLSSPPSLHIDRIARCLRIGDTVIALTSLELALYVHLVQRRVEAVCPAGCPGCRECFTPASYFLNEETASQLKDLMSELGVRDERSLSLRGWSAGGGTERFYQVRSSAKIERSEGD
jgi:CRISPR-associated protein (TIGR02584 family)